MTISGERRVESAAEEIVGNEDLVREIHLRLPVNSLLRFKSVSKKWLSLISDPYFTHIYTRRHNPNLKPSGLLLKDKGGVLQFIPFNDDSDQARVTLSYPGAPGNLILQSCNGLLMCCSGSKMKDGDYTTMKCYVCNPTTKQFSTFKEFEFGDDFINVNLAFDPLKSPHYKLVYIRRVDKQTWADDRITRDLQIDIYSSETGSWRPPISGDPRIFTASLYIPFTAPVYYRSALHWHSSVETSLYFNIDTECLKTMPMPPMPDGIYFNNVQYFGESGGHLHLIVINNRYITEFDILELETDYSGWFVQYHINLDAGMMTFSPTPLGSWDSRAFSVGCFVRADGEKESTLVLFVFGEVISFNLHNKTSKKVCDLVPRYKSALTGLDYKWYDAYKYIETLFYI